MAISDPQTRPKERLVVVIAGAGARGAYEAGALSYILPRLRPKGLGDTIFLGTSAGAINAVLWAARAKKGLDLETVGQQVIDVWQSITQDRVFKQPLWTLPKTGAQYLAGLFGSAVSEMFRKHLPPNSLFAEISGVLDTKPLAKTATEVLQVEQIRKNIKDGALLGVGVVATTSPMNGSGGRSRIFIDTSIELPNQDQESSIDFTRTSLRNEHVLASAAIPVAFPAIRVPAEGALPQGYYIDGGVRLNAPIEPAVKLGATTLLIVSSHATEYPPAPALSDDRPDALDVAAQSIHSMLADGMIEDVRTLKRINTMVAQAEASGITLRARSQRAYRKIDVISVSPLNGQLSPLATRTLNELGLWQKFNHWLLSWLLSGAGRGSGNNELLSYLLFHPTYFVGQFKLGEADARKRWEDYQRELAQQRGGAAVEAVR